MLTIVGRDMHGPGLHQGGPSCVPPLSPCICIAIVNAVAVHAYITVVNVGGGNTQIATYSVSNRFGGDCSLNEWQFEVDGHRPQPPATPTCLFPIIYLCLSPPPPIHVYPPPPTYIYHPTTSTSRGRDGGFKSPRPMFLPP